MKHHYTDEQMQAAIDAAFNSARVTSFTTLSILDGERFTKQTPARLDLIKTALALLPEPPPPVADGKTQLSTLRPIAEAGEVPAGCVRYFFQVTQGCSLSSGTLERGEEDTHFAVIRLPESKEEKQAETFTAHGKTWIKHDSGHMPCDGERMVECIYGENHIGKPYKGRHWNWGIHTSVKGWRYADEPTPEVIIPEPRTPKVGDVVKLKSGGPKMSVCLIEGSVCKCQWFRGDEADVENFESETLQPA